jgi:hypothetical protein
VQISPPLQLKPEITTHAPCPFPDSEGHVQLLHKIVHPVISVSVPFTVDGALKSHKQF